MKSLYLRIYLTLVVLLLAFAFGSTWLFQQHLDKERGSFESVANERMTAMAELLSLALPSADAPTEQQAEVLEDWGQRLRMPVALNDAQGRRIASSELFLRRLDEDSATPSIRLPLKDGRSLELMRMLRMPPGLLRMQGPGRNFGAGAGMGPGGRPEPPSGLLPLLGPRPELRVLLALLLLLFLGVAIGAYPVIRRLTRRLEALRAGVEHFGAGNLTHRVDAEGSDEVAVLAASFNRTAGQIETLLRSQKSLLANASHELRSPLARLKMAFSMLSEPDIAPAQRERLSQEIHTNIAELDSLVEEVLLASRLEAANAVMERERVDLLGLAAEESARIGAEFEPAEGLGNLMVRGEERLLRRALRNLLENARRYGGAQVLLQLGRGATGAAELRVCDRGPGVPEAMRERIFEAFFRLPGHAEQAGGVGLGLNLVKQIAQAHGGQVRCEPRQGGGSCFVLTFPPDGQ
ncbi:HAMP domain-containing histidine kinase [Paucibacter sp. TC2R-5]|uniref:sensor histidine kinase n=1 Tax=Paucibacter sp. TC2R-5 TaxID=2893555 RepID=UPI0021E47204|nr:HAMP domain-containing sensor histidine kinase [Paucibacter sp. TC2R-5]MCV2358039.1 HAMP domain-containing histidine kinase [Paucibacter sp. TC2R-5]